MRAFAPKPHPSEEPVSSRLARSGLASHGPDQRERAFLHTQRATEACSGYDFSQISIDAPAHATLQAKLATDAPGGAYEQEADRIAQQVMRAPEPEGRRVSIEDDAFPTWRTEQPTREQTRVQAKTVASDGAGPTATPPIVHDVVSASGQRLDTTSRAFMESRFGHDFGRVRIHTDDTAATSAKEIGALAYTYGADVVFGAGQYAPQTVAGGQLLAHELAHVVQQGEGGHGGALQLKRDAAAKPTQPTFLTGRDEDTDRIEDAYGAESLSETQWRALFDAAEQAIANGQGEEAMRAYLTLYADVAKLAQFSRVVSSSGAIHMVTGNKSTCSDAKPGLNFSMDSRDQWGANATTAFVDDAGKFGVTLRGRGAPQPEVAIVLTRSAFRHEKEQTLAILRHEMIHAEHDNEDAAAMLLADRSAKEGPKATTDANTELLGYVEGFMTMFHLTHPAPTSSAHPVFVELLGVLDTGHGEVLPWADATPAFRSEALGRLQEYYCHALDWEHRDAFDAWVGERAAEARRDRIMRDEATPQDLAPGSVDDKTLEVLQHKGGNPLGAQIRKKTMQDDFFQSLQSVIASKCKELPPTSMKL